MHLQVARTSNKGIQICRVEVAIMNVKYAVLPLIFVCTWIEGLYAQAEIKLTPGDAASFGQAVAIVDDYAIVSALQDSFPRGLGWAVYVYKREDSQWVEQTRLVPSDGTPNGNFGWHLAYDGEYAVVGAHNDYHQARDSGSAYVYKREGDTWIQQAKLIPFDGAENTHFGLAVSVSGGYALIGSGREAAYIFKQEGTTWVEKAKLVPSDSKARQFGKAVSLDGDYALVGASGSAGSAYVFKREGEMWVEQAILIASEFIICTYLCDASLSLSLFTLHK